ncbi:MAG: hypothetical protein ACSHXL_06785, partial [Bacteroidota bacterium]
IFKRNRAQLRLCCNKKVAFLSAYDTMNVLNRDRGDWKKPKLVEVGRKSLKIRGGGLKFTSCSGVLFRRLERQGNDVTLTPMNERYAVKEYHCSDFDWIYPVYGVFERLMS